MASITITTKPTSQLIAAGGSPVAVLVAATYVGANTLLYKWMSCDANGGNATAIVGATAASYTPGAAEIGVATFLKCELSAVDHPTPVTTNVVSVYLAGLLPDLGNTPLTGAKVFDYVEQCDESVKNRLTAAMARTGIVIPDTDKALRTAQIELFMGVL